MTADLEVAEYTPNITVVCVNGIIETSLNGESMHPVLFECRDGHFLPPIVGRLNGIESNEGEFAFQVYCDAEQESDAVLLAFVLSDASWAYYLDDRRGERKRQFAWFRIDPASLTAIGGELQKTEEEIAIAESVRKRIAANKAAAEEEAAKEDALYRTWRSSDGRFAIEAKYVRVAGNDVIIESRDGRQVEVKIRSLSTEDRKHIAKMRVERRRD